MIRPYKNHSRPTRPLSIFLAILAFTAFLVSFCPPAAATDVVLREDLSLAGNIDFVITGGTLRVGQCTLTSSSSASLSGVPDGPANEVIRAAYLYWAGSGDPDYSVTFQGSPVTAPIIGERRFTESDDAWVWFGGFADVTNIVRAQTSANTTYTFTDLDVDTSWRYCTDGSVLAGWALIVIYEDSDTEPLRVINIFDGLQKFWGSSFSKRPDNFQIPSSGIDGKFGVLTWEGDAHIDSSRNGLLERLRFNGNTLEQNPINLDGNQYNATISPLNAYNVYGVDFDVYDIGSYLSAGQTSASTFYSSGQDFVLLTLEIVSVTNTAVADLSISKSNNGDFVAGQQGAYTIRVTNNGPNDHTGEVRVTDTLPTGLTYASATGTNWSCNAVGQVVTCTTDTGPIAKGVSLPDITLIVNVDASAVPSVTNTARVQGAIFDNNTINNRSTYPTKVMNWTPLTGAKQLYFYMNNATEQSPNTIQRVVNSNNSNSGNIAVDASYTALLSPATQMPFTLRAGNIPASLLLRRRGSGGTRNVTVTLEHAPDGSTWTEIGSQTRSNILGTSRWQYITFNIPLGPTDLTLPPGSTLRFKVTNGPDSPGVIRARSLISNAYLNARSQITLDTPTVINVSQVIAHSDEAYPDGSPQASFAPNTHLRLRAVVNDPFGHSDITSATLTLLDPNSNPEISEATMTAIATPPSPPPSLNGTKIFEYRHLIPSSARHGTWTAVVTAHEGTEGTISRQGTGTFMVGMPNVSINKTVTTILKPNADLSDPTAVDPDAYAIPGAIMRYDVVVTNTGIGPADLNSVVISDLLPPNLRLVLNGDAIAPVRFIDGPVYGQGASGLTFNPLDVGSNDTLPFNDVALSNNVTAGAPPVSLPGPPFLPQSSMNQTPRGVDSTEPRINYIRINPKGTFAGATDSSHPSFTLQFRLEID